MLGHYQIAIFKQGSAGSRHLQIRGWVAVLAFLFIGAVIACNIWLWQCFVENQRLGNDLTEAKRVIAEQRRQTISLAERIGNLGKDLDRVRNFDSKIRLMMNMEKEPVEFGQDVGSFTQSYLPLHRQELAARKMQDFLDHLSESTKLEEVRQQDIMRVLRENRNVLTAMPSIWPVTGFISSNFGGRISPFGGGSKFHKGLDIANRVGTPIIAPADGTVIMSGHDGAYGLSVELNHGGGIVTKYAHMQRTAVKQGEWVKRGQVLGYIGLTGRTTGPHLHYEVRLNGVPVNPMRYILE